MATKPVKTKEIIAKQGRLEHAYAIVRLDGFAPTDELLEHRITVKKVVRSPEEAEREVERLNQICPANSRYFAQLTRLEKKTADSAYMPTNRISGLQEPIEGSSADRAFLESLSIPDYISKATSDGGFGFPGIRVYETCGFPTERHQINWEGILETIFIRRFTSHADVVGVGENENSRFATFAFTAFDDLIDDGIGRVSPLEIVKQFAEKFGLNMFVGSKEARFFLQEELPIPTIVLPGQAEGQFINIENPNNRNHVQAFWLRLEPPKLKIALAFAIDTMAYQQWIDLHGGKS